MSPKNHQQKQTPEPETESRSGDGSASEPIEISMEQIEELKLKAAKAEEYWERLLRVTADFENAKKRAARERQDAVKYGNESLLTKLIPVLDSLEMATASAEPTPPQPQTDPLKAGVVMILIQLRKALAEVGLEEVDATNLPFDPNLHEAVSQEPSAEVPDGHVVRQLRKGYRLNDRLIRPATVVVARNSHA